jgi:parallel beta-helix repeat protein
MQRITLVAGGLLGIISFQAGQLAAAEIPVATPAELEMAISAAAAGDEIVLAAGTYPLTGVTCSAAGTQGMPITVRSAQPLGAVIEFDAVEGFHVTGPYWHFEGLDIKGVCANDSDCEHAFHVVGHAVGFVMRNSRIADFNAHLKVNNLPENGTYFLPDGGLVERNEIFNTHPRSTSNPVTPLNIDNASDWIVRANIIYDFHKAGGDEISYGAFNKGGGKNPLFERNLVICARNDTTGGYRVGLSFGGGGQAPQTCAPAFDPNVPCDPENEGGIMRNNIIVNCSDVGIYLNKAKDTQLLHNTLIATTGIDFRFMSSTGEAHGNVLTSQIRVRDNGSFSGMDNLMDVPLSDFMSWYLDPLRGDLRKNGDLSQIIDKGTPSPLVPDDYCARARTDSQPDWGALEHSLGDCVTTQPPPGTGTGTGTGAGSGGGGSTSAGAGGGDGGAGANGADNPGEAGGCGCRIGGPATTGSLLFYAFVAAALGLARRRS